MTGPSDPSLANGKHAMYNVTSPRIDDEGFEALATAKAFAGPRVKLCDVEAAIIAEHYFTAEDGANNTSMQEAGRPTTYEGLSLLTFCVLILANGFVVTGESACVSPENFSAELGQRFARQKALDKVWMLLGYDLRSKQAFVLPQTGEVP